MIQFNKDFHGTHATLTADPRLFANLFGLGPKEFCSLSTDTPNYNDELCWRKLERHGTTTGWAATIPTPAEIAEHAGHTFNDGQPRYPWRHIDECPIEVEPYPLCLKLLQKAGHTVAVTPDVLPYCGGLHRYGGFMLPRNSQQVPTCEDQYLALYRSILDEYTDTRLAKGYGLTLDGIWVPSEWFVQPDGTVHASKPRIQYYGVLLDPSDGARYLRRYLVAESEGLDLPMW